MNRSCQRKTLRGKAIHTLELCAELDSLAASTSAGPFSAPSLRGGPFSARASHLQHQGHTKGGRYHSLPCSVFKDRLTGNNTTRARATLFL